VPICKQYNIDSLVTANINSEDVVAWINQFEPDVIFCFGWSTLLKKPLLELAPLGVIGYHPAKIPMNRGRHPLIWALALGLKETASTFFFMDEGADTGDILDQRELLINDDDDAGSLYKKIIDIAKEQLASFIPLLESRNHNKIPQNQNLGNTWRKREKKDGEIDWRMGAIDIYNLVRALTYTYVGAHFVYKGEEYKVWKCRIVSCVYSNNIEPGKIIQKGIKSPLYIKCGRGCIELLKVEPEIQLNNEDYL